MQKNNLLFYMGNFSMLGDLAGNAPAILGVCDQFDLIVAKLPSGPVDLAFLKSIIAGWKISNPNAKFFGWTSLGTSLDLASWELAVDAWETEFGEALDGIFIDHFGFEQFLCSRPNQNAAVDYCHGKSLSAFVRCTNVVDAFDEVTNTTQATLGRTPTITDYVMLADYYQLNQNSVVPAAEPRSSVIGRLQFSKQVRTDVSVTPNVPLALKFAALLGAGLQNTLDLRNVWTPAANALGLYGVEYLGVVPYDESDPSAKFFIRNEANFFAYNPPCT